MEHDDISGKNMKAHIIELFPFMNLVEPMYYLENKVIINCICATPHPSMPVLRYVYFFADVQVVLRVLVPTVFLFSNSVVHPSIALVRTCNVSH